MVHAKSLRLHQRLCSWFHEFLVVIILALQYKVQTVSRRLGIIVLHFPSLAGEGLGGVKPGRSPSSQGGVQTAFVRKVGVFRTCHEISIVLQPWKRIGISICHLLFSAFTAFTVHAAALDIDLEVVFASVAMEIFTWSAPPPIQLVHAMCSLQRENRSPLAFRGGGLVVVRQTASYRPRPYTCKINPRAPVRSVSERSIVPRRA